jgi:hypothetical protein
MDTAPRDGFIDIEVRHGRNQEVVSAHYQRPASGLHLLHRSDDRYRRVPFKDRRGTGVAPLINKHGEIHTVPQAAAGVVEQVHDGLTHLQMPKTDERQTPISFYPFEGEASRLTLTVAVLPPLAWAM